MISLRAHAAGILVAATVLGLVADGSEPAKRELRAGAAKADITPQKWPLPMVGSFSQRLATKAWDPLHARAIVLDDGTTKIALVVIDSCYVPRNVLDDAKRRASGKTGIPTENMLMSATHTHTAPAARVRRGVEPDPDYVEHLIRGVVQSVVQAHEQLEPAEMASGVVPVPEELFNRRWFMKEGGILPNPFGETTDRVRMNPPAGSDLLDRPAGPTDPDVSVVALRGTSGRPIALLANYSLHYVGGIPPGGVSADYFGEFARIVEKRLSGPATTSGGTPPGPPLERGGGSPSDPPVVGILSNGTSGDVNNINFRERRPRAEPFERMRQVAERVADAALSAVAEKPFRRDVSLAMAQEPLTLKKRRPTRVQLEFAKAVLATEDDDASLPGRARPYARWAVQLEEPPYEDELVLQAVRIGDVGITAIPCEVFTEIGLEIKRTSSLKPTFTIELANGHYGYLPTPRQHALGGYETWLGTCILEEQASVKITEVVQRLLHKVAAGAPHAQSGDRRATSE